MAGSRSSNTLDLLALPGPGAAAPARVLEETDAVYVQLDGEAILLRNPISLSIRRRGKTAVLIPEDSALAKLERKLAQ
jgi:hypothetical protein